MAASPDSRAAGPTHPPQDDRPCPEVRAGLRNLADGWERPWPADEPFEILIALLHQKTGLAVGSRLAFVQYPRVPWFAVMALGYVIGGVYALEPARRRRIPYAAGAAAVALFLAGRGLNGYGDPRPWSVEAAPWLTAASFLALEKYPPSLLYLALTLGPALLALAWLDGRRVAALGLVVLWPVCRVYARFRRRHPDDVWLRFV